MQWPLSTTLFFQLTVYGIAADVVAVNAWNQDLSFVIVNEKASDHGCRFVTVDSLRSNLLHDKRGSITHEGWLKNSETKTGIGLFFDCLIGVQQSREKRLETSGEIQV